MITHQWIQDTWLTLIIAIIFFCVQKTLSSASQPRLFTSRTVSLTFPISNNNIYHFCCCWFFWTVKKTLPKKSVVILLFYKCWVRVCFFGICWDDKEEQTRCWVQLIKTLAVYQHTCMQHASSLHCIIIIKKINARQHSPPPPMKRKNTISLLH